MLSVVGPKRGATAGECQPQIEPETPEVRPRRGKGNASIGIEIPLLEESARSTDDTMPAMYPVAPRQREQMPARVTPRTSHQDVTLKIAQVFRFHFTCDLGSCQTKHINGNLQTTARIVDFPIAAPARECATRLVVRAQLAALA